MNDPIVLFAAAASACGAVFAAVAAGLRRGRGPWALLAATAAGVVLLVTLIRRLYVLDALFMVAPAIPALLMEAGVLEWRARRAARKGLWREVVWGTAAFLLTAIVGAVVALAGFRCTGCVG